MLDQSELPPVLILLHGGPGMDASYFEPYVDSLRQGAELLTYTQAAPPAAGCDGLVEELGALIARIQPQRQVFLLGHSFGGALAIEFLTRRPMARAFSGLILASWVYDTRWLAILQERHAQRLAAGSGDEVAGTADERYRASTVALADLYFTPRFLTEGRELLSRVSYNAALQEALEKDFLGDLDLKGRLGSLSLPVLSLTGANDEVVCPDYVAAGASMIPGARHIILDGAGHFPFVERREAFASAILSFIREQKQRSAL